MLAHCRRTLTAEHCSDLAHRAINAPTGVVIAYNAHRSGETGEAREP
jgi:hypothetical protein